MKKLFTLIAATVGALALSPLTAAAPGDAGSTASGPTVGRVIHHDVSQPMREIASQYASGAPGSVKEINPLNVRPGRDRPAAPPFERIGIDPSRQTEASLPGALAATPGPLFTFEGLSDDDNAVVIGGRIVPPDTNGDIGPNHYVQYINLIWAVWDIARDGDGVPTGATLNPMGILPGNSFWSGFGGPCEANNNGDPIVLYDHLADRWLATQFSINEGIQCVALSTTPDPTGAYTRWAFLLTPGGANDYPKFGLMPDAYYATTRDFGGPGGSFSVAAHAMDRVAMLAGSPTPEVVTFRLPCVAGNCAEGVLPPHLEGPPPASGTPGIFSIASDAAYDDSPYANDGYRLWELTPNFGGPPATFVELPFVVAGNNFDRFLGNGFSDCISPVLGGEVLDCLAAFTMFREQFRSFDGYDSIVINTTVDAGTDTGGIQWAELRNSGGGWALFQDGTYAPADGQERWMGSIAMDGAGNIALGYSVTSGSRFPSIAYNTRSAGDAPGTLPGGEEVIKEGTGAQQASANRWGDYSSMSVDPVVDCTFWYTNEYYQTSGSFDFNTHVGVFQLPCGDGEEEEEDDDGDGVLNEDDVCPLTEIPDDAPSTGRLGAGRYSLQNPIVFSKGASFLPRPDFTIFDTNGCSCDQLLDGDGIGAPVGSISSQRRRGCTLQTMRAQQLPL